MSFRHFAVGELFIREILIVVECIILMRRINRTLNIRLAHRLAVNGNDIPFNLNRISGHTNYTLNEVSAL
ncbi:hypothetical protein D3C75_1324560 [compost metagenome]